MKIKLSITMDENIVKQAKQITKIHKTWLYPHTKVQGIASGFYDSEFLNCEQTKSIHPQF